MSLDDSTDAYANACALGASLCDFTTDDEIVVMFRGHPFIMVPDRQGHPTLTRNFVRGRFISCAEGVLSFLEQSADGVSLEWRLSLVDVLGVARTGRVAVAGPKLSLT